MQHFAQVIENEKSATLSAVGSLNFALPADFPISHNMGLHGDVMFFELGSGENSMHLVANPPELGEDRISFQYMGLDSDEGAVTITYININGDGPLEEESLFDVEISTGSDVWGLLDTQNAINHAITLHRALGRDIEKR